MKIINKKIADLKEGDIVYIPVMSDDTVTIEKIC